jgi:type II secretory pathway component PulC
MHRVRLSLMRSQMVLHAGQTIACALRCRCKLSLMITDIEMNETKFWQIEQHIDTMKIHGQGSFVSGESVFQNLTRNPVVVKKASQRFISNTLTLA